MGKTAQLVMGPAGSGKSTFCSTIQTHLSAVKRSIHLVNLDPAADQFDYQPSINIMDFITLQDVMEDLGLGPNGGLLYCLDYFISNLDWFESQLEDYDDDHLIIDCPGQIELYTHCSTLPTLVKLLERKGYRVCGVYLLDVQFLNDTPKFFSGIMTALSSMLTLPIPFVNVLTKMDLIPESQSQSPEMERYYKVDPMLLQEQANKNMSKRFWELNKQLVQLLEEFQLVELIPLDKRDEDSIQFIIDQIDNAVQYGEDVEPKEIVDRDMDDVYDA